MFRRIRVGALAGTLAALTLVPAGGAVESPWPDLRHGWAVRCSQERPAPQCRYGLYSTDDGGHRWRLIYPADGGDIAGFLRTSAGAGVLSTGDTAPAQYWTRDDGRHWYTTRHLPSFEDPTVDVAGKGNDLFWSRRNLLYEIVDWVPRPGERLLPGLVHRVEEGTFTDLEVVPPGVAAAVLRGPGAVGVPLARLLVGRLERIRFVTLQDPEPVVAARVAYLELVAAWPSLTVLGEDSRDGTPVVTWRCGAGAARAVTCDPPTAP